MYVLTHPWGVFNVYIWSIIYAYALKLGGCTREERNCYTPQAVLRFEPLYQVLRGYLVRSTTRTAVHLVFCFSFDWFVSGLSVCSGILRTTNNEPRTRILNTFPMLT